VSLKPGEIRQVHGDDGGDAVREHGRDQVRVMNLLATAVNVG
jgi:hypothetical protein